MYRGETTHLRDQPIADIDLLSPKTRPARETLGQPSGWTTRSEAVLQEGIIAIWQSTHEGQSLRPVYR